ncbi:GNAT family N-acetyltransferase [Mycolicibacterium goodii]|uniref:GNAT family N-acetyltransferase n=1 Tax=Mycolicibacterium goodii TaxID=134601 RepID=A0ABS6HWN7_MYCGD|nr:GNAT family N-acetyltransferase [Mycolicibacterium goodii]MBU8825817.1 GNAT family N-acetyltransferase [Mycolicibacterium goodii]MBU8840797.1 GNAT family N-acetyltransferase [Mycolicibacterium goodii]
MTVVFAHAEPDEAMSAFFWHRGFAAADDMLFPRSREEYERLAHDGRIVKAIEDGMFVGLCYYTWDEHDQSWEVGGLMVDKTKRGRSLGSVIMRVTLGHLLFEEEPLSRHERIITHVHSQNNAPRNVIEHQLKFAYKGQVAIPSDELPGLAADVDGYVRGDLFELVPDTLHALAAWCDGWDGTLRDGSPAEIELMDGVSVNLWARAFRAMADDPIGF